MNRRRATTAALLGLLLGAYGCSSEDRAGAAPESEQAVHAFCEAIVDQDFRSAYSALHPESRARFKYEQFLQAAVQYRRNLGFEPVKFYIRACEEHDGQGIAHVVFSGSASGSQASFKDTLTIRQGPDGWGVVLAVRFGKPL